MVLYLHGFASGPSSFKARTLAARFASAGATLEVPDLTPGPEGFERSTPLTMLAVAEARLAGTPPPHALVGSSLGGYLAAVLASRDPSIERLVLLAPAFRLFARWDARLTPAQREEWRTRGLETEHHATGTVRRIAWAFHEDAARMPELPDVKVPTLVITGLRDEVVPVEDVRAWVGRTRSARLVELDDGHELAASIDRIWQEVRNFLGV
jgi:pimeloyl-ACP methyl ester carboxylesterase